MAEWKSFTLSDLYPSGLADTADAISDAADLIGDANEAIASAVDTVQTQIETYVDPLASTIEQFQTLVTNGIQDFEESTIWALPVYGRKEDLFRLSTEDFIRVISESFYDVGDTQRPVFTETASVFGQVLLFGSLHPAGVVEIAKKIKDLFGIEEFAEVAKNFVTVSGAARLREDVTASDSPQTIRVSFSQTFPDNGVIEVGDEVTAYSSKGEDTLIGVVFTRDHSSGEEVRLGSLQPAPPALMRLSADADPSSTPVELEVDSTSGFPESGVVVIGGTEVSRYTRTSQTTISVPRLAKYHALNDLVRPIGASYEGRKPDWSRLQALDYAPGVGEAVRGLSAVSDMLDVAVDTSSVMSRFKDLLLERSGLIQTYLDRVTNSLDEFQTNLANLGGHTVTIIGTGLQGWTQELEQATERPEFNEEAGTLGVVFLAGTIGPLNLLFGEL